MKKRLIISLIIVIVLLLIPFRYKLKDGGSVVYKSAIYKITKYHIADFTIDDGYQDGVEFKILGIKVYKKLEEKNKNSNVKISYGESNSFGIVVVLEKEDINYIEQLLTSLKYDDQPCDGINDMTISFNGETYFVKTSCKEIQKDSGQSSVTSKEIDKLINIFKKYDK